MIKNNSDTVLEGFLKHLENRGVSPTTVKNYKSDIVTFTNWLVIEVSKTGALCENLTECIPMIHQNTSNNYKGYLEENNTPIKTINRRLSSLRQLAMFLVEFKIMDFNFLGGTPNILKSQKPKEIDLVIEDFKRALSQENTSKNTIKNYISDVKQFFNWIESSKLEIK